MALKYHVQPLKMKSSGIIQVSHLMPLLTDLRQKMGILQFVFTGCIDLICRISFLYS